MGLKVKTFITLLTVMFNTRESIIALITGTVAGLAAGLLLAPERLARSAKEVAFQSKEDAADEVDMGNLTTSPLSEISEDAGRLEALRSQLEAN
jgi:gas vesicle protein